MICRDLPADYYFQKRVYGVFQDIVKSDYSAKVHYLALGCCGPEQQRDRNATVTTTGYDYFQRFSFSITAGISTLYCYNAMGRVLSTTRKGCDNSYNAEAEYL